MKNKIISKLAGISPAAKSSLAFAISSFFTKGITFLVTPVFTRLLDSSQYGLVAEYNSWVSIIEVFAFLGLTSAGVFNVGINEHKEDRDQYISSILCLCNIVTISVFVFLFCGKLIFGDGFILPNSLLLVMLISFLFSPAQIFWITRQRYEYKYKAAFIVTITSSIVSQLVSVLTVVLLNGKVSELGTAKIWSSSIALLIVQIPIYTYVMLKGKTFCDKKIWKATLRLSLPLIPHYLAQHVMSSSDRIMISNLYSQTGAAIYSVVANISMITTIIWSAINASLIPATFETIENKKERNLNVIIIPLLLFYSFICLVVTIIAPEILRILAPGNYYNGIFAVPPIAITAFLTALYNIYANVEFYHKKTSWIAFATIIAAAVNLILNYLFIPKYGYIAAAYTTLVSHIVLIVMHYIGYNKSQKTRIYNDRIVFIVCAMTIVICLLCNILYIYQYVRYVILVGLLLLLFFKRKYFITTIRSIKNS